MLKRDKAIYDKLPWWKRAEYDIMSMNRNHWETAAQITLDKDHKTLYRDYADAASGQMERILRPG